MNECSMIGRNLKSIRTKMKLSLNEAAALTGVSKTMLSQIERSESNPTITVLWKIANGLKIRFESLLEESKDENVVKSLDEIVPLVNETGDAIIYNIVPFEPMIGFDIFYAVFKPGCSYQSGGHLNGKTEYFIVAEGEIELEVEEQRFRLKKNDFISFDSCKEHRYVNNSPADAVLHMVLSYN